MSEMDDIIKEFIVESTENIDKLDQELVALEKDPGNKETINKIFRIVHTIKGTCGFLGFGKLESVTHKGESLLDSLRSGRLSMSSDIATALLQVADATRVIIAAIAETKCEGEHDFSELVSRLIALNRGDQKPASVTPVSQPSAPSDVANHELLAELTAEIASEQKSPAQTKAVETPQATKPAESAKPSVESPKTTTAPTDTSLRVDVTILDKLMNLVSELVLTRNQIIQFTRQNSSPELLNASQRLNIITTELQEGVMRTRMQPIENVWNKFPRIVRDIAKLCEKEVRIEMEGKETDLDKTLIEAIKDPLTHIIRNSVDHGIEKPEVRAAAGKPREGVIKLKAYHESGCVIIEIADDGAGLNTNRIRSKALERGVISQVQAERMTESEIHALIFAAGFSTAEQVTNISGRGVGMDVVRSNIQKIGGVVDVSSVSGNGTLLKIKIPLTLAIVPALIVSCSEQRFAVPQVSLVELVRITNDGNDKNLEHVGGSLFYRLRGSLLPLVRLDRQLNLRSNDSLADHSIVVIRAESGMFGLVVEKIHDTEEIVVKPMSKQLKSVKAFSGATIMGDGKVALILDVASFAQFANCNRAIEKESTQNESAKLNDLDSMLLVACGTALAATPLSTVHRLEKFKHSDFEHAGGKTIIQYRGGLMPIYNLASLVGESGASDTEECSVVVYSHEGKAVGLAVDRIVDIVQQSYDLDLSGKRPGIRGTAVLAGKVTEVIDLSEMASMHD
jgi:two-component system chemotaxis sensor kinase CheA